MYRECPYCMCELVEVEDNRLLRCENAEGFTNYEDVLEYICGDEYELEEYCSFRGVLSWNELKCESSEFRGLFWIDKDSNLKELI